MLRAHLPRTPFSPIKEPSFRFLVVEVFEQNVATDKDNCPWKSCFDWKNTNQPTLLSLLPNQRNQNEHFPLGGRHDAFGIDCHSLAQDSQNAFVRRLGPGVPFLFLVHTLIFRHQFQNAAALLDCLLDSILGSVYAFCVSLQFRNESVFYCDFGVCGLAHEETVQEHL